MAQEFSRGVYERRYDETVRDIQQLMEDFAIRTETKPLEQLYRNLKEIGAGSFGRVYSAIRRGDRRREVVAIKEIDFSARYKERARWAEKLRESKTEIQIQMQLKCDLRSRECAVVPIYDFFTTPDRRVLYIVMKFVRGTDGQELVYNRDYEDIAWDEELFRHFLVHVRTLDAMHEQGILHRDIKPANTLYDEQDRRLYVSDFGLACILPECTGQAGTPIYMDPLLFVDRLSTPDRFSDTYALGLTFVTLLLREDLPRFPRDLADTQAFEQRWTEMVDMLVAKYRWYVEQAESGEYEFTEVPLEQFNRWIKVLIQMIEPYPRASKSRPTLASILTHLESEGEERLRCGPRARVCPNTGKGRIEF